MGTSTNAVLFYGVTFGELEGELHPHVALAEPKSCLIELYRLKRAAYAEIPELRLQYAEEIAHSVQEPVFEDDDLDRLIDHLGVEIGYHCHGDYPLPYLQIMGHGYTAYRGDAVRVAQSALRIDPDWDERLEAALKFLGLTDQASGIDWWLVSYWG